MLTMDLNGSETSDPQRTFEDSSESSQGNSECSKKLDSIINTYAEILQLMNSSIDRLESSKPEMKEGEEKLVEMMKNCDKKWDQASAAYKNIHSTTVSIKNVTDATASKVDANTMQVEGFLKNDVSELKRIADEFPAKIEAIKLKIDRNFGATQQATELYGEISSNNAAFREKFIRRVEDLKSMVDIIQEYMHAYLRVFPIGSCPTSPNVHYNNKACITPVNSSFQHVDSSHAKVDEKSLENTHLISTRTSNGDHSFQKKSFSDKLLKQNSPAFCVEIEAVNGNSNSTDRVSTCHNTVSKSLSFNNNLSGPESEIAECREFHEVAKEIPQSTACNDSKQEPDQTKVKVRPVSDETAVINATAEKNEISGFNLLSDISDSSSYVTNTPAKPKNTDCKEHKSVPDFKNIFYEKSIPKMTVPHSGVSIIKKYLKQQNGDQQDKEEHSQTNVSMSATALDDCKIPTNNDQNVSMSEGYAVGIHEKLEEGSPENQSIICNKEPNNSKGKAISQGVAATPNFQRPPTRQNPRRKCKKHDSKADVHFRVNVLMSRENVAAYNSASIPSTSRGIGPYYLRSKDPAKGAKMENESSQQLKKLKF